MKIEKVIPINAEIIEFEDNGSTYQRSSGGSWMILMGDSWETCYMEEEELEAAYQAYMASKRD